MHAKFSGSAHLFRPREWGGEGVQPFDLCDNIEAPIRYHFIGCFTIKSTPTLEFMDGSSMYSQQKTP